VLKAAGEDIPLDKGKLHLDFKTEVIDNNKDARSDYGGGQAAHMQPLNGRRANKAQKKNP